MSGPLRRTIEKALRFLAAKNTSYSKSATRLLCHTKNKAELSEKIIEVGDNALPRLPPLLTGVFSS